MSIVGPVAAYIASVLLVFAGYMTYRKKPRRVNVGEVFVIALWPVSLLVAFFVAIGWLIALIMEEERVRG